MFMERASYAGFHEARGGDVGELIESPQSRGGRDKQVSDRKRRGMWRQNVPQKGTG